MNTTPSDPDFRNKLNERTLSRLASLSDTAVSHVYNVLQVITRSPHPSSYRFYIHMVQPLLASFTWELPWGRVTLILDQDMVSVTNVNAIIRPGITYTPKVPASEVASVLEHALSHPDLSGN